MHQMTWTDQRNKTRQEDREKKKKSKEPEQHTHTHIQPASRAGDRSSAPIRQYKSSIMVEEVAHKFCLIFYFIHFFFSSAIFKRQKKFSVV